MLALTVHNGEYITIGPDIVVQVLKTGDVFRLAIDAPRDLTIVRETAKENTADVPECIQKLRDSKTQPRPTYFKKSR